MGILGRLQHLRRPIQRTNDNDHKWDDMTLQCDRCCARAQVEAILAVGAIYLCTHHYNRHRNKLDPVSYIRMLEEVTA
jgi:hypothetical protein